MRHNVNIEVWTYLLPTTVEKDARQVIYGHYTRLSPSGERVSYTGVPSEYFCAAVAGGTFTCELKINSQVF